MKKIKLYNYLIGLFLISLTTFSLAVEPEEFMKDPDKELRARDISKNIRCVVCQNQSIDDSSAQLAKDLRILIRQKIKDGSTDEQIYNFLTERYGDFILLNPPLKTSTVFLWLFPIGIFLVGFFIIIKHHKKSKANYFS